MYIRALQHIGIACYFDFNFSPLMTSVGVICNVALGKLGGVGLAGSGAGLGAFAVCSNAVFNSSALVAR